MMAKTVGLISYELTEAERASCDEMKRALGIASDEDLMALGLWMVGDQVELPMGREEFTARSALTRRHYRSGVVRRH
jgi:hypothetical protein